MRSMGEIVRECVVGWRKSEMHRSRGRWEETKVRGDVLSPQISCGSPLVHITVLKVEPLVLSLGSITLLTML